MLPREAAKDTHGTHTRGETGHSGALTGAHGHTGTQTNLTTILTHQRTHALDRTTAETGTGTVQYR